MSNETQAESQEDNSFLVDGHQAITLRTTFKYNKTQAESQEETCFPAGGHQGRHQVLQDKSGKPRGQLFPSSWPPGYSTKDGIKLNKTRAESQEDYSFLPDG